MLAVPGPQEDVLLVVDAHEPVLGPDGGPERARGEGGMVQPPLLLGQHVDEVLVDAKVPGHELRLAQVHVDVRVLARG